MEALPLPFPSMASALFFQILLLFMSESESTTMRNDCSTTAFVRTDPIVNPNGLGPHVHTFFGSNQVAPSTTWADLRNATRTSCEWVENKSLYWAPSVYRVVNGQYILHRDFTHTAYYNWETGVTRSFPNGFRMIAGGDPAIYPTKQEIMGAGCGTGLLPTQVCSELEITLIMPECWDGVNLDSPDHRSHVAYPTNNEIPENGMGTCPASHPVPIPRIRIFYRLNNYPGGQHVFSDGTQYIHADYFFGWDQYQLQSIMDQCTNPHYSADQAECPGLTTAQATTEIIENTDYITTEPIDNVNYLPGFGPTGSPVVGPPTTAHPTTVPSTQNPVLAAPPPPTGTPSTTQPSVEGATYNPTSTRPTYTPTSAHPTAEGYTYGPSTTQPTVEGANPTTCPSQLSPTTSPTSRPEVYLRISGMTLASVGYNNSLIFLMPLSYDILEFVDAEFRNNTKSVIGRLVGVPTTAIEITYRAGSVVATVIFTSPSNGRTPTTIAAELVSIGSEQLSQELGVNLVVTSNIPNSPSASENDSDDNNLPMLIGIVVVGVVVLGLISWGAWRCFGQHRDGWETRKSSIEMKIRSKQFEIKGMQKEAAAAGTSSVPNTPAGISTPGGITVGDTTVVRNSSSNANLGATHTSNQAQTPASARGGELAAAWTRHFDDDTGRPYWWNSATGESTWNNPTLKI
eukprot:jgi/Bigna1/86113/estExt_fgenesh1_pg.C_80105